jgi:hypothetical protein
MATTTNYSWTTPDDTDLVKDGASAIRTLGSSVDTTVKALSPGTTAGDIDYYTTSTAKARVGIGTAGQVLQVNSGATAPEWVTPAAGGKVLQVVQGTLTGSVSSTSTSYADTGLSVTITPSSATSKILIHYYHPFALIKNSTTNAFGFITLIRGATDLAIPSTANENIYLAGANANLELDMNFTISYLDSPGTTSATTYKTQFKVGSGSTLYANRTNFTSSIIAMEIGA